VALGSQRVLDYSLQAFAASPVAAIVVVVPDDRRAELAPGLLAKPKVCAVTGGGPTRQDSLARGLAVLPEGPDIVLVHDAARPMVTPAVISAVIEGVAGGYDGALAAVPLDDAIKEVDGSGEILRPRARTGLWRAQTPQGFTRTCLEDALEKALAGDVACDDCSEMATRAGYRVHVVLGDPRNIKVTRPDDLEFCERLLADRVR
jgi:2-C-methyl-D-erythritol 4-phosphate cytidylyltransferase